MGQGLAPAPSITEPARLRAVAEQAGLDVVREAVLEGLEPYRTAAGAIG